ncbi:hypothetical protein ES319_A09G210100v1 [Gossypium barbadense]|uniref:Uncharacterized protein n=2 Tax=Gossypium TaxID=3633 RepID=A0A5J5UI39_GOSBA|nr:hypothetical protein ES319_A09G210100v1 [Gossypium barbadense]TYH03615.1 hypothetical protein ES288_A09G233600v1 [Gossypium darwinii]
MELDLWSIAIIVVTFAVSFGFLKKAYERGPNLPRAQQPKK